MSNPVNACRHFMLAIVEDATFCAGLSCYLIGPLDVRGMPSAAPMWRDRRLEDPGRAAVLGPGHERSKRAKTCR